jgi:hypothetical protein
MPDTKVRLFFNEDKLIKHFLDVRVTDAFVLTLGTQEYF